MWLGRDAVRLDRLLGFICENTSPNDPLLITSSIGPILTAETGDVSLKRPSFWRRREAALMLFRSEKKRSSAFEARQLIEAIKDFAKSSNEGEVVVKIQINGKLHQLQGDIKLESSEDEDGTFFLSASTVITQVFEEPGLLKMDSRPTLEFSMRQQEPAADEAEDDYEDQILEIEEIEEANAGLDAWTSPWAQEWDEAPEDEEEEPAGEESESELDDPEPEDVAEAEEGEDPEPEDEAEESSDSDAEDEGEIEGDEEPEDENEAEAEAEDDEDSHDDVDPDEEPEEDAEQEGDGDDADLENDSDNAEPEDGSEQDVDAEQDDDANEAESEESSDSGDEDGEDNGEPDEDEDDASEDDDADEAEEATDSHGKHAAK